MTTLTGLSYSGAPIWVGASALGCLGASFGQIFWVLPCVSEAWGLRSGPAGGIFLAILGPPRPLFAAPQGCLCNGLGQIVGLGGIATGLKPLARWLVTSPETFTGFAEPCGVGWSWVEHKPGGWSKGHSSVHDFSKISYICPTFGSDLDS
ncbi:hypothetical protein B0H17DRAFT_1140470 [Mycena rosella]|uniref:Uncharacterized protein n=1 Tax=Mycena rosella TaxID=1033263 RepID=A0AAD7G7P7_MYCRO|nr:hypothetical protein B0H17DRAFT_1140470 [Mycena rosella]